MLLGVAGQSSPQIKVQMQKIISRESLVGKSEDTPVLDEYLSILPSILDSRWAKNETNANEFSKI